MREQVEFHLLTMASRSNYSTAFHMKLRIFRSGERHKDASE